jgi:hypothetical protein
VPTLPKKTSEPIRKQPDLTPLRGEMEKAFVCTVKATELIKSRPRIKATKPRIKSTESTEATKSTSSMRIPRMASTSKTLERFDDVDSDTEIAVAEAGDLNSSQQDNDDDTGWIATDDLVSELSDPVSELSDLVSEPDDDIGLIAMESLNSGLDWDRSWF